MQVKKKKISYYADAKMTEKIHRMIGNKDVTFSEVMRMVTKLGIEKANTKKVLNQNDPRQLKLLNRINYLLSNISNNMNQISRNLNIGLKNGAWFDLNEEPHSIYEEMVKMNDQMNAIQKQLDETKGVLSDYVNDK